MLTAFSKKQKHWFLKWFLCVNKRWLTEKDDYLCKPCSPHPPQAVPLPRWGRLSCLTDKPQFSCARRLGVILERSVSEVKDLGRNLPPEWQRKVLWILICRNISLCENADAHSAPLRCLCVKCRKLVAISFIIWLLYNYKISNIFVGAHRVRPFQRQTNFFKTPR